MMKTTVEKSARTPTRWLPQQPFAALRDEMDSLFHDFFGTSDVTNRHEMIPSVDVSETDTTVEVKTDLPGFQPEDVTIELQDNVLTISGQHEDEERSEDEGGRKYHRVERRTGKFSRSVWLPAAVNTDEVTADLNDGVLTVSLPKVDRERPLRVPVKAT